MSVIDNDIRNIVGGHFTPDALSPEVHAEIVGRVRNQTVSYIDRFEEQFLSVNLDPKAQSNLYLPTFLELASQTEPRRASEVAAKLLKFYDAVLVAYDEAKDRDALFRLLPEETVRYLQRLDTRRLQLKRVAQVPSVRP